MRLAAPLAVLGLALCLTGSATGASPHPKTHTVTIDEMRFQPDVLTVSPGDTVVWVNKDLVPHTATSGAGGFDSKELPTGKSWSYKATAKGDFAYVCTIHPTMRATLKVH